MIICRIERLSSHFLSALYSPNFFFRFHKIFPRSDSFRTNFELEPIQAVCVRLEYVDHCRSLLGAGPVGIACVIAFHEGTQSTASKLAEAQSAIQTGASELDIVLNYPLLLSSPPQYQAVYLELQAIRKEVSEEIKLKLIIETSQLDESLIVAACALAHAAKFDFVKTSTGFRGHGAQVHHVKLMKSVVKYLDEREGLGRQTKVKASGGIKTWGDALSMVQAGASRIGASSGMTIVTQANGSVARGAGESDRADCY
jgi:deoxyribose-phosphate aldolase